MKKLVLAVLVSVLLVAAPAYAGGLIPVPAGAFVIPQTPTGCTKVTVVATGYEKDVVRCVNTGSPSFYIVLPGMVDTAAALTHQPYVTTPATSGNLACWLIRQAAFPVDPYNTRTVGLGTQYSRSNLMQTVAAYQPNPMDPFSVPLYNAALGSTCADDDECDNATIILEIIRNTSTCGGGNVPNVIDLDGWNLSW